jgi:hypothetical protein
MFIVSGSNPLTPSRRHQLFTQTETKNALQEHKKEEDAEHEPSQSVRFQDTIDKKQIAVTKYQVGGRRSNEIPTSECEPKMDDKLLLGPAETDRCRRHVPTPSSM